MKIEGVIFDCDGTLVDSEIISMQVLQQLCLDQGLTLSMEEAMDSFAGNELAVVLQILEDKLNGKLPVDFLDTFRSKQLAELAASLTAIHGAHELVKSLTVPTCVASNAPLSKVNLCLQITALDQFFPADRIFSAYTIEKWKPAPDLFLQAAQALAVPPQNCLVVEDSLFGVQAGVAAGMQVVALDRHSRLNELPEGVVRVECLTEIRQLDTCG
ncbi:MAG: HAD-IA family hydrolase [Fuerstiella sp.]